MGFSLFSTKNRIINLVLNDHSIRFLELKQSTPPTAQKWSERFLPPGIIVDGKIVDIDSLANILEQCIEEWKIQRRSIRFIVPDPLVIIRKVSIPADIQEDEIKGYLYLELGSTIHLPFEEPVFDYHLLKNNGKTQDILLFAAPEQFVMEYSELFSSLKLDPVAADISPLALYRLYNSVENSNEKEILFTVQFDLTSVNLCIFEGSVPMVMRHFALPFNVEDWEYSQGISGIVEFTYKGASEELVMHFEDIFREINKLVDYYRFSLSNEKQDVTKFLVNGDHPMLKAIYDEMNERFEVPVQLLSSSSDEKAKAPMPSSLLISLGLALKEVQ